MVTLGLVGASVLTAASAHPAFSAVTNPPSPSPSPSASPTSTCTGIAPRFSCLMQQRIAAVQKYLAGAPGSIGILLDDRATGAIWHNANATTKYPAASTMKLAMITDLLLRNRPGAGRIHLTATDRKEINGALYTSNDIDATDLWDKYENGSFLQRIRAFGMTGAEFTGSPPSWGFMYCSAQDLDDLINYVLSSKTPAGIRDYLVYRLRHVSPIDQQWGVWGAGPENRPGNKDGWEQSPALGTYWWIINTVGFAVPGPEFTLAIMYNLYNYGGNGDAGFYYGVNKLTQIASILFQGHYTAIPHPQPSAVP